MCTYIHARAHIHMRTQLTYCSCSASCDRFPHVDQLSSSGCVDALCAARACVLSQLADIFSIATGKMDEQGWCKASAFLTIACVFADNGLCMCVAFCTYLVRPPSCSAFAAAHQSTVRAPAQACQKVGASRRFPNVVMYWSVASWTVGLTAASVFAGYEVLGSYRGLCKHAC
jgi:hypothetical protein